MVALVRPSDLHTMKSNWLTTDQDDVHKIIYIEDVSSLTGGMTITNDAERVIQYHRSIFGHDWRVVYKDTDGEWWEIIADDAMGIAFNVEFKPWNGLAWDILSRKEVT